MNHRAVLLSLAPEFAAKIAAGTKTVELRRRFPRVPVGTWVYFYVTLPVGAVVGRARISAIDVDAPSALWRRHRAEVGVPRTRFDAYFAGLAEGVAISLTAYAVIEPIDLDTLRSSLPGFVPPQSYRFLDSDAQARLIAPSRARSLAPDHPAHILRSGL